MRSRCINIKSVTFNVAKKRISKSLMSTVISVLTINSLNSDINRCDDTTLSSYFAENKIVEINAKFGVPENLKSEIIADNSNISTHENCAEISSPKKSENLLPSESPNNSIDEENRQLRVKKIKESAPSNIPRHSTNTDLNHSGNSRVNKPSSIKKSDSIKNNNNNVKKASNDSPKISNNQKPEISNNVATKIFRGKTYVIKDTIKGKATAYSLQDSDGGGPLTATGCKVFTTDECTCIAVDPKQIPYYSDLLIEFSNGKMIKGKALDTGGAIRRHHKGVVVDIYMKTSADCNAFGRQDVTVYRV